MPETIRNADVNDAAVRSDSRRELSFRVPARVGDLALEQVRLSNLSQSGFLADFGMALEVGQAIGVELPRIGWAEAAVVWTSDHLAGCTFRERLSSGAVSAALLRAEPSNAKELLSTLHHDPTDPMWDVACEAGDEEKLPLRMRLLLLTALVIATPAAALVGYALLA